MESFHITVLTIATIIFIISLTTIGVMIQKSSKTGTFPPTASNCPDGWTETSSKDVASVVTYTCTAPTDFTTVLTGDSDFTVDVAGITKKFSYNDSTTSICDKQKFANKHNITWDGVSNYNSC